MPIFRGPGKDNGLERGWIGSSLKISPLEQIAFLRKLVNRELPVTRRTVDMTLRIVEKSSLPSGWQVQGKTGMAYPRQANGGFDEEHPYGWFVGWATQDERWLVFARLIQDDKKEAGTAGARARCLSGGTARVGGFVGSLLSARRSAPS